MNLQEQLFSWDNLRHFATAWCTMQGCNILGCRCEAVFFRRSNPPTGREIATLAKNTRS